MDYVILMVLPDLEGEMHQTNTKIKMQYHNQNKQIIIDFYTKVLGQGDVTLANSMITEDYIQHSPTVKTGKVGFMEFMSFLSQLPKSESPAKPFFRFICDSSFVAVQLSIEFMGQQRSVLDLFRIENGMLAEHWDASEDIDQSSAVEGPITIEDLEFTSLNKSIVSQYMQEVLIDKNLDDWGKYISSSVVQHNPVVQDGIDAFKIYYNSLEVTRYHKIVGEGNFVMAQCEGNFLNEPFVIYDTYRLKDQMIVEHWSVKQAIPDKMANSNGMI